MNSTGIFIADDRLRPIWRFFLSVVLLFAAFVLTGEMVGTVFLIWKVHPSVWVAAFWQSLVGLVAIIAAFKLMTAVFERRPLGSVGLAFHPRWWRELGRGLVVGAAMLFARDRAGVGLWLRALHVYPASDAAGGILQLSYCLPWRRPMRKPSFAATRSSGWLSPLLPWGPLPSLPRCLALPISQPAPDVDIHPQHRAGGNPLLPLLICGPAPCGCPSGCILSGISFWAFSWGCQSAALPFQPASLPRACRVPFG